MRALRESHGIGHHCDLFHEQAVVVLTRAPFLGLPELQRLKLLIRRSHRDTPEEPTERPQYRRESDDCAADDADTLCELDEIAVLAHPATPNTCAPNTTVSFHSACPRPHAGGWSMCSTK